MTNNMDILVTMVHEEIQNDPEWLRLKAERDKRIKDIEEYYHKQYLIIRKKYWKKYGIPFKVKGL